jgi:tetratricopeptide (TPR) repeat protein
VETRPYMRARYALADALDADGQVDEAIAHYRELIRLNPGDNQGARRPLLVLLVDESRDQEARALIDQFKDDESAEWLYADALVAFRLQAEDAIDRLRRALAANRHVPPFLSGEKEIPELPESYRMGSVDEAVIAADWLVDAWTETPGAIFWLNTHRRLAKAIGAKSRRKPNTDR